MGKLFRFYLMVRKPRNFLKILVIFLSTWLFSHWAFGTDGDFGAINLILSTEASIAGAVLMMVAEESAEWQRMILTQLHELMHDLNSLVTALVQMAQLQRDADEEHTRMLELGLAKLDILERRLDA